MRPLQNLQQHDPMQRQVPVDQSDPPMTPFQSIAADFFDLAGVHYLVTVDRLSGWLDLTRAAAGTSGAGAKGLIACLRLLFVDKEVPEVISSRLGIHSSGNTGFPSEMEDTEPPVFSALPSIEREG